MKPDKDKQQPKAAPKKTNGRVFDVQRPGKAAATPTSKPIILGHKPEAQQAQTSVSGIGEARPLLNKRKIEILPAGDIKPVVSNQPTPQPEANAETVAGKPEQGEDALGSAALDAVVGPPDLPAQQPKGLPAKKLRLEPPVEPEPEKAAGPKIPPLPDTAGEPTPQPEPEETKTEPAEAKTLEETKPAGKNLSEELPKDSTSVPDETAAKESPAAPPEEEAPPEPKIEPLFDDSGHIVVSQHHHHRRHGARVVLLLLLILLLAAAALNIALDLGILRLEPLPHTDFL